MPPVPIPSSLRMGPADVFALALDRIIRHEGGPGNIGVLSVHLDRPVDMLHVSQAWQAFGRQAWPVAGRFHQGLRGLRLLLRGPADLHVETADDQDAARRLVLTTGTGRHLVRLIRCPTGLVLGWHHGLCDARAAQAILAGLGDIASGRPMREAWWTAGYRDQPGLPATAAARGRLASSAIALLKPHRLARLWKPLHAGRRPPSPANDATPHVATLALGAAATAAMQARQRTAVGRMGEAAFVLAALAAALEATRGVRGDILMPLAVDLRPPGERRLLANCHGYAFLRVPAGLPSADLSAAARHLQAAQKQWIADQGSERMGASLQYFAYLPHRLVQAQLGFFGPGVHASAVAASTGKATLSTILGAQVTGIDHAAAIPGCPGVGALFHHDARGLVIDALAAGRVADVLPPSRLAEAIRWQLVERPLTA
jgi:hypothetical protein